MVRKLYREQTDLSGIEQVEILCPFRTEGAVSALNLNETIREDINRPLKMRRKSRAAGSCSVCMTV